MEKNETRFLSYTTHRKQLKWMQDLNLRPKAMKLQEKTGKVSWHWSSQ